MTATMKTTRTIWGIKARRNFNGILARLFCAPIPFTKPQAFEFLA